MSTEGCFEVCEKPPEFCCFASSLSWSCPGLGFWYSIILIVCFYWPYAFSLFWLIAYVDPPLGLSPICIKPSLLLAFNEPLLGLLLVASLFFSSSFYAALWSACNSVFLNYFLLSLSYSTPSFFSMFLFTFVSYYPISFILSSSAL